MLEKQQTIAKSVSLSGVGLHTGTLSSLKFIPAPENYGIKFVRVDLPDKPVIDAHLNNVTDLARGTTIGRNGAQVHTVEHVMSALYGMQIDNALVEVDGIEPPVMDGSSIEAEKRRHHQAAGSPRIHRNHGNNRLSQRRKSYRCGHRPFPHIPHNIYDRL